VKRMAGVLGLLVTAALLGGCAVAAKQAVYTITGPRGNYLVEEAEPPEAFASYQVLWVEGFENTLPRHISGSLVRACRAEVVAELREAGYFRRVLAGKGEEPGPALILRGRLLDIKSDRIPGQRIVGGANHLIAHIELVDAETGEVRARGVVRGLVKSVAHSGEGHLAEGLAEGVRKFVKEVVRAREEG